MILPKRDKHFKNTADGDYQIDGILASVRLSSVKSRNLAIDVGAHVGYWTKEYLRFFRRVISIEPQTDNFRCLVENTPDAIHINAACGETIKKVSLNNLAPYNSGAWNTVDGDEIDCITIDSLNESPDLMKIDVQGYEKNVIKGAEKTIKKHRPVLCVEVILNNKINDDLVEYIRSLGYVFMGSVKKDSIFVHSEDMNR